MLPIKQQDDSFPFSGLVQSLRGTPDRMLVLEAACAIEHLNDKVNELEYFNDKRCEEIEQIQENNARISRNENEEFLETIEKQQREIDAAWDWYGEALMEQDHMKEVNSVLEEKYIQTRKQNENLLSQVEFLQRKLAQVNTKKTVRLIAKRNTKVLFPRKMFKK